MSGVWTRGAFSVFDGPKGEKVLAFGFKSPLGLATDTQGNVTVADSGLEQLLFLCQREAHAASHGGLIKLALDDVVWIAVVEAEDLVVQI